MSASSDALRAKLGIDPDVDLPSLRTGIDKSLSIGQDVWRLRWRNQFTTAVRADASLHTTCGALLDALALLETNTQISATGGYAPTLDVSAVNVLIDRPLPRETPSESDQALRSMRDAIHGVPARLWYRQGETNWIEDTAQPPKWPADDSRIVRWVESLLKPRLKAQPGPFTLALLRAVNDRSLNLYPSEIADSATDVWALRIDGLQIGISSAKSANLQIGKPGKFVDGPQRTAFKEVFGKASVTVSDDEHEASTDHLSIAQAADGIRRLLCRFRQSDVRDAPIVHRKKNGLPYIDEHTLEARLLNGLIPLDKLPPQLVLDDSDVARGSQFPTLWGLETRPRYLDAMLRHDTTPIAVELKVATGGQGRYYRRALIQAVLYRHFIHNAPALESWFQMAGLDRMATQAGIGVPSPILRKPRFEADLELLTRIADRVGARVYVIDDRMTTE